MIKRLWNFDREDWLHIGYLVGYWILGLITFDENLIRESKVLLRLHLNYDRVRVSK